MAFTEAYDLIVIGGGINGTGIARDAAGRGLSVLLCEADDLAGHTSSASTKLIHGGLRYLEQYEFRLVAKALAERKVLLKAAPHIIRPLRFILPHQKRLRPAWTIRAGLFLYDHLGGRRALDGSKRIRLDRHPAGASLLNGFKTGFAYSDAWTQDSRLVVLNAVDAAERGARILTRTRCESAERTVRGWRVSLATDTGARMEVSARSLVNATGPWAVGFLDTIARIPHRHSLRLIKGSHIVVPRLFDHDLAYILQQPDRRIVFAIPYERDFTLIGTTDVEHDADPAHPRISTAEIDYLCAAVNRYFMHATRPADIIWSYSGVRPLLDDHENNASDITRDYEIELDIDGPPLLNVFGGKLTTHRRLAEDAVNRLTRILGHHAKPWTGRGHPLPGGDMANPEQWVSQQRKTRPWLPPALVQRLVYSYGTRIDAVLGAADSMAALGEHFGADLYATEVDYLCRSEWARTAEDIIWRRSKLGLRLSAAEVDRLHDYLERRAAERSAPDEEPKRAPAAVDTGNMDRRPQNGRQA